MENIEEKNEQESFWNFKNLVISSDNYNTNACSHARKHGISYFISWWIQHPNLHKV